NEAVEVKVPQFSQSRVDVSTNVDQLQIRTAVSDHRTPTLAAGRDSRPLRQGIESAELVGNERIARRSADRDGGENQSGYWNGRQIFQAVNRKIGPAVAQRVLDRLGEQAVAADLRQRLVLNLVTVRLNNDEFHSATGGGRPKQVGDVIRLPQRQWASAGTDSEGAGHAGSPVNRESCSRSRAAISACGIGPDCRRRRSASSVSARSSANQTGRSGSASSAGRGNRCQCKCGTWLPSSS